MRTATILTAALGLLLAGVARAAVPSSGTLTPASGTLTYTAGPFTSVNPSPQLGTPDCDLFPGSCDEYLLTTDISAAYLAANPDHVVTIKVQWPVAQNDFDVYLQDAGSGQTLQNSASNSDPEVIRFTPLPGVHQYKILALAFTTAAESFTGTITLGAPPEDGTRVGAYVAGADVFTCNVHLTGQATLFDHGGDSEPGCAYDPDGNLWVTSNAGLGGGIGLWKVAAGDACSASPVFRNSPDQGAGGGDTDVIVAPEQNLLGFYNIYTSSLSLANITSSTSLDGGDTFVATPVSDPVPVNDRQWNAAYGANTLYLSWRSLNTGNQLFCARSDDGGLTFGAPIPVYDDVVGAALSTQLGNMAADTRPGANAPLAAGPDGEGNVYHGYILTTQDASAGHKIYVAVSRDFGVTWTSHLVYAAPPGGSLDHIFSWLAVDRAGNVYTAWCDSRDIYYSASTDIRTSTTPTWSQPVRVNNGPLTKTCTLPMLEAGSAGRIVFGFYGTSALGSQPPLSDGAQWHYFQARTNNALDAVPVIEQMQVSDHVMHTGRVCEDGINCDCCRELYECQELAIDPRDGSTLLTYAGSGGTYITKQVGGTSAIAGETIVNPGTCAVLGECDTGPPPVFESTCIAPGLTVATDPTGDENGTLGGPEQDIEHVWFSEPTGVGSDVLLVRMKVAELPASAASLPVNTLWTVLWNNPVAGDPFPRKFVQMNTCDPLASPSFAYGHVEGTLQSADGDLTTGCSFSADGTIEIRVPRSLVGSAPVNGVLGAVTAETRLLIGTLCSGSIQSIDAAAGTAYVVRGNGYCTPHTVACAEPVEGTAGDYLMEFVVSNASTAARAFQVTLSDANGWLVGGPIATLLGPVSASSSASLQVVARLPNGCPPNSISAFNWTATAEDLPSADAARSCQTTATCLGTVAVQEDRGGALAFAVAGSNPFRERTLLSYTLPHESRVKLEIFDIAGRRVRTLVDGMRPAGSHQVALTAAADGARGLGAGVYLARLDAAGGQRRLVLITLR